jgi:hypothetical protein
MSTQQRLPVPCRTVQYHMVLLLDRTDCTNLIRCNAAQEVTETQSEAKQLTTSHLVLCSSRQVNFHDYDQEIRFTPATMITALIHTQRFTIVLTTNTHISFQFMAIHKLQNYTEFFTEHRILYFMLNS